MPQSLELVSHVSSANCRPPLQLEWSEPPAESVTQLGSSQIHAALPAADRTSPPNHPNRQLTSWRSALAAATGARLSRNTGVARYGSGSGPRPGRRPPAPACAGPGVIREFKILDSEAAGPRRRPPGARLFPSRRSQPGRSRTKHSHPTNHARKPRHKTPVPRLALQARYPVAPRSRPASLAGRRSNRPRNSPAGYLTAFFTSFRRIAALRSRSSAFARLKR